MILARLLVLRLHVVREGRPGVPLLGLSGRSLQYAAFGRFFLLGG